MQEDHMKDPEEQEEENTRRHESVRNKGRKSTGSSNMEEDYGKPNPKHEKNGTINEKVLADGLKN